MVDFNNDQAAGEATRDEKIEVINDLIAVLVRHRIDNVDMHIALLNAALVQAARLDVGSSGPAFADLLEFMAKEAMAVVEERKLSN